MRTADYDALVAAAPVNKAAALVRDAGGEHWSPVKSSNARGLRWDSPPPIRPLPQDAPDLTGWEFGWFRVIGLLDEVGRGNGARWVVRCRCGYYETRRARSITKPDVREEHDKDRCSECDRVNILRKRANPSLMVAR